MIHHLDNEENNIIVNHRDIWMPNVRFNSIASQNELIEEHVVLVAKRIGNGTLTGEDVLLKDYIYNGNENPVKKTSILILKLS